MMHRPRALVCDLDGTLVDSAPDIAAAANRALDDYGADIDSERARRWLGHGATVFMQRALAHYGIAADAAILQQRVEDFSAAYAAAPCTQTRCYDGAVDTLAALRNRGLATAVCTNKPEAIAGQVLDRTGLIEVIDVVVGAGRYALKPAPDGLHACLDQLGVAPADALYIGDHEVDVVAARAAGLRVAIAAFGYAQQPVAELRADAVFHHWAEIAAIVDS